MFLMSFYTPYFVCKDTNKSWKYQTIRLFFHLTKSEPSARDSEVGCSINWVSQNCPWTFCRLRRNVNKS